MAKQAGTELHLELDSKPGERLADGVYRALRRGIADGLVPARTRLVETDVAEVLGVSRTPVREALRRLETDGMLESAPHRGFVVCDPLEDAATVYTMRQRLEGLAARMAAEHITVPQLKELDRAQAEMERLLDDDSPGAIAELGRLNAVFHTLINEAAGSPRLSRIISYLAPMYVSRQVVTMYSEAERRASFESHRQILAALWARDEETADRLVQEHLEKGKRVVLDRLERRRGEQGGA